MADVHVDLDLVKRLAELVDGDGWEVADLLAERFPPEEYPEDASGRSGLRAELSDYEDALRREYGVELKGSTMRLYRSTSLAWSREERSSRASFTAHHKLRGADRRERMARYLKRNGGRSLSMRDVARYRADDNPTPVKPWDVRARQRIESTVKSLLLGGTTTKRDDWWNLPGVDESRDALIEMLFDLGNRMGQS